MATKYRGYTITDTGTTIDQSLHGGKGNRPLYKVTDKDGFAERNHMGNLPIITTTAGAKDYIDELLTKMATELMGEGYPACLNDAGQAHVGAELERLGLDWDVSATCSDIEDKLSFGNLTKGNGDTMDYDIRGGRGFIEIEADKHVTFADMSQ